LPTGYFPSEAIDVSDLPDPISESELEAGDLFCFADDVEGGVLPKAPPCVVTAKEKDGSFGFARMPGAGIPRRHGYQKRPVGQGELVYRIEKKPAAT
jgi:hypothetical protein